MEPRIARQLPFPVPHPEGYPMLEDEPVYDPAWHLAIELPDDIKSLADLGYAADDARDCPTQLAITAPFRILSDAGAAALLDVCRALSAFTRSNERISRMVRGGAYQSRFLRDLCLCPEVTAAVSKLCQAPMHPHTIPHQLGHLNYNPHEVGENVDKWHVDTLRVDFVLFVTDPKAVEGGEFEYYHGTKEDVAARKKQGLPLDPAKIVQAAIPGPGFAVLQQGNMVVHRAKGLLAPGERITMVNGYVPADTRHRDFSRYDQLRLVDPEHIAASEYFRHIAWMGQEALAAQLDGFAFSPDRKAMADHLAAISEMLATAASELRKDDLAGMDHFGDE